MNEQEMCNSSRLQGMRSSASMFYIKVEPSDTEIPFDSQGIPLNILVNSPTDHILVPVMQGKQEDQVCLYVEPIVKNNSNSVNNKEDNVYEKSHSFQVNTESISKNTNLNNAPVVSKRCSENKISHEISIQILRCFDPVTEDDNIKSRRIQILNFVSMPDRVAPPRAVAVLPAALRVRRGGSVVSRLSLHPRVRFGPVEGINQTISREAAGTLLLNVEKSREPIFLLSSDNDNGGVIHIDVSDKDKSNWFSLLPLGDQSTANVWLYQEDNKLYGITVKLIPPGTRLALGYSKEYAQDHGLQRGEPVLDVIQELSLSPRRWGCAECARAYAAPAQLQRHVSAAHAHHTEKAPVSRRKWHRCQNCTRTFSRIFTLRRHMARHCNNKAPREKKVDYPSKALPEVELSTPANSEDNRLPSDESLQNYTNGLDFSTSLFDTDRMPGLDISASSRSEAEFNPYGLAYRDENEIVPTDLGFEKLSNVLTNSKNNSNKVKEEPDKPILISCVYCQQTILREKKRQHLSECPGKQFNCECGRKFLSKEKLAKHVHQAHPPKDPNTTMPGSEALNPAEYRCGKCTLLFKRRGMLVNHLWRVHKSQAAVPLTQRVRHFPCGACPKLYRSAAKRDRHVRAHHPGAAPSAAIESGRRLVAAAACAACPRQYASRAKLLQHVRQRHPQLAVPSKKQLNSGLIPENTPPDPTMQQGHQY